MADVDLDQPAVVELAGFLHHRSDQTTAISGAVEAELEQAHRSIGELVGDADGRQVTADKRSTVHHFANVLFNCMRGGVFPDDHRVVVDQLARFVSARDRRRHERFVGA